MSETPRNRSVASFDMVRSSYLRVYEPLALFPARERAVWSRRSAEDDRLEVLAARKWLIRAALPGRDGSAALDEGAYIRRTSDGVFVCPWRTRLRMLTGLLAFRGAVPDEVADAFVPIAEAQRAAQELAAIDEETPEVRSHILQANWHVPLRWFAAFEDSERMLVEDKGGLRVRYETSTDLARARLRQTVRVLEDSDMDEALTEAVRQLLDWLSVFSSEGLLELDYGGVARMFEDEELLEDRSAAEVAECLQAIEARDLSRAGRVLATLTERWTEVRSLEILN